MVPSCDDKELEKKLEKKSPLWIPIQNRLFFFCFDFLIILENSNTGGIQRANEWSRWDGEQHSTSLLTNCEPFTFPGKILLFLCKCSSQGMTLSCFGVENRCLPLSLQAQGWQDLEEGVPPLSMWKRDGHCTWWHWSQEAALSTANKVHPMHRTAENKPTLFHLYDAQRASKTNTARWRGFYIFQQGINLMPSLYWQ